MSPPENKRPAVAVKQQPDKWNQNIIDSLAKKDGNFYFAVGFGSRLHFQSDEWAAKLAARDPFELLPLAPEISSPPPRQLPAEDGEMWYFRQGQFHKL